MGKHYSIPNRALIDAALAEHGSLYVGDTAKLALFSDERFQTVIRPWQSPPLENNFIGAFFNTRVYIDYGLPPNALEVRDTNGRTLLVTTLTN